MEKSAKKNMIVLGNGPSLQQDILNNQEIFEKTDLGVVNHFCHSEFFFQLKPENYFLLDPGFFNEQLSEPVEKTYRILKNDVNWEITFYLPWNSRKSAFVQGLRKNKNLKFRFVNYVTAKGGFRAVNHWLYDRNLAMPQCQNVVIYMLFLAMRIGVKRIFLFGAENNWHTNVKVNKENYLVLTDLHLYQEKKEYTERILGDPSDPAKKTTMTDLLESSLKVFKGYEVLSQYAQTKQVQIYNCSKNSLLDRFERLDDDEFKQIVLS
ncbi:hypothetical protein [Fluviicola sp.]|jgi:hypothetical protein|uniref:hypothetical protein n=1 Tax=Fluviicola sp. TaxID=1917219 RepID=UPI00281ED9A6|nr:hypothetical protein [Fluviicola sp.]MDR0801810.1 hypothetical protein [Fluviicola sp.]